MFIDNTSLYTCTFYCQLSTNIGGSLLLLRCHYSITCEVDGFTWTRKRGGEGGIRELVMFAVNIVIPSQNHAGTRERREGLCGSFGRHPAWGTCRSTEEWAGGHVVIAIVLAVFPCASLVRV